MHMREFAERLVSQGEVEQFLRILMLENHVPTDAVLAIAQQVKNENVVAALDYAAPGHDICSRPFSDRRIPPATASLLPDLKRYRDLVDEALRALKDGKK